MNIIHTNTITISSNYVGSSSIQSRVVDKYGNPIQTQVKLFHLDNLIMTTQSDENGYFEFKNININDYKYYIIAHDPKGILQGDMIDNIGRKG